MKQATSARQARRRQDTGRSLRDVLYGRVDWEALGQPGSKVRLRMGSTAVRVEHEGPPESSSAVRVTYVKGGNPYRVMAKGVVMAGGQHMNKYVVRDAPAPLTDAMNEEGFGWYTGLRAPMVVGGEHMPLDPSKPTILTFYIPFTFAVSQSGLPLAEQASKARSTMFSMPYREIERRIREQMTAMFGAYGFDARRDIAGLITNRWGHAYVTPQPGFYFGLNGKPAPRDAVRKGYGRVRFGHSELTGFQLWDHACDEGERAARQAMEVI